MYIFIGSATYTLFSRLPRLTLLPSHCCPSSPSSPVFAMLALRESPRSSTVDTTLIFHRPAMRAATCSRSRRRHSNLYIINRDKNINCILIYISVFYPIIRYNVDANPYILIGLFCILGTLRIEPYYSFCL